MAKNNVSTLTNAVVYREGTPLVGRAEEVKLPERTNGTVEHVALGLRGKPKVPNGMVEYSDMEITWAGPYPEVLRDVRDPSENVTLQIRGVVNQYDGQGRSGTKPAVVTITGPVTKGGGGSFKAGDANKPTTSITPHYYKFEIGGQVVDEFDVFSPVAEINAGGVLGNFLQGLRF